MKFKTIVFLSVLSATGIALTGCMDEKLPKTSEINRIGCVDPSDPDVNKYFYAHELNSCVTEKTSFYYGNGIYCCKQPPQCSDYGFYQLANKTGTGACTDLEIKTAQKDGKESKIVMENDQICCYHPTCVNLYGFEYAESDNDGKDECGPETFTDAATYEKEPTHTLPTGETCCFHSPVVPLDGPNCDSGWITVSETEKAMCTYAFTAADLNAYDHVNDDYVADASDENDDGNGESDADTPADTETYFCKQGRQNGKVCRYVPAENQNSRVTYQFGQTCSAEQLNPDSNTLRIHVMDIGQGDSIWIQTPTGQNVLVDGGDGNAFNTQSAPIISDYLINHGFPENGEFDAVFLTHPHSDHFGGFISLFGSSSKFGIKNYIDPMELDTSENVASNYKKWIASVQKKVPAENIYMPAENKFEVGASLPQSFFGPEIVTEYLYSSKEVGGTSNAPNPNTSSIIFRLTYAGRSMLFTGDAEAAQEKAAINTGKTEANFLKVCHHGSTTSSSEEFLKSIWLTATPSDSNVRGAFISSGRRNFGSKTTPTYIPDDNQILPRLKKYLTPKQIFSTSAGDDSKRESQTYRDDNILIVIKPNGDYYACYAGTN